ncbi:methylated-DNA--[protein]-cysteine S-methyltransferase [Rubrivivax sp. A210]|uniref:methylated-DNA--[protein]-cysteine S-methyltransferase n=1 Tax=Rubrivivax sp. A210 TaxID=2772301 RepID=UPI00191B1122|nr:methylated-DNA--[protein]-cysteine S-methyltransferase [Rubrivivax sp. A210]
MKTHDQPVAAQGRIETPLGPLTLWASARGLMAVLFDAQKHHPGDSAAPLDPHHPHIALAAQELNEYFAGSRRQFAVPLDPQGTPFQQAVWQALLEIECGALSSYGEVARRVGRPAAVRAVGAAVGRNPLSIIVPCHRVVGSDGSLTGYAGGLPRKRALLALEGALSAELAA